MVTKLKIGRPALVALVAVATALGAAPADAQPRPLDRVSVRAELVIDDAVRRVARDGWTMRHNGPWLNTNDQWTNAAGVTSFPANTAYWITTIIDECVGCDFEVRFFDEAAGGYFPLNQILRVESDGGMLTATGRFEVERDTRGELYVQMTGGPDLYPTYLILAQIR